MNSKDFIIKVREFSKKIKTIKEENTSNEFTWYGYDILANLYNMKKTLSESSFELLKEIKNFNFADIGAADGDLSFFFEEMGYNVDIIDWPRTNWNNLQGAYCLKKLLGSSNNIYEINLDSFFTLPKEKYGLIFLLGTLYHLKNPYFTLEYLSKCSKFCFLSTKIARFSKDNLVDFSSVPIAYLLNADECNNDDTNYWIFSHLGLNRIIDRTGWEILDIMYSGDTVSSNPSNKDERAFVFMRSKHKNLFVD